MVDISEQNSELQVLIDIISNTTEAYTTALFLSPRKGLPLELAAYQSLSGNIKEDVSIKEGEGLIGWVYKNQEPVNVDKFDQDTRRLFFYSSNEAIKSFMAIPLPEINGVLAVDSKNRYVFTEKNQKILNQFGQALIIAVDRVKSTEESHSRQQSIDFLSKLDEALYARDPEGLYLKQAASLVRNYFRADAFFIAGILPNDQGYYHLKAADAETSPELDREVFRAEQGLMGWMIREKKPLFLKKARLDNEKSYIFYPEDPFKDFTAVAGLPLVSGRRLQGSVCLCSRNPLNIDDTKAQAFEMAAGRLASALEMERLAGSLSNLGKIDPQTGLPHRSEFCQRADKIFKAGGQASLVLFSLHNLEQVILDFGQKAADMGLNNTAKILLDQTVDDIELGHLLYGTFGLLIPNREDAEVRQILKNLTDNIESLSFNSHAGKAKLEVKSAVIPRQRGFSVKIEDLIHEALALL